MKRMLLVAVPIVFAATLGSSGVAADPARALGDVIGQRGDIEVVKKGGKGPKHFGKRGRAWALTRGRGRKVGLRRRF